MKIHIHKRIGNKYLTTLEDFDVDKTTGAGFKLHFEKLYRFYPERQSWNIRTHDGPRLNDEETLKEQLGATGDTDEITLYFKDLGMQVSWRLVFVMEYAGPLIFFPLFYYFPSLFYKDPRVGPMTGVQNTALFLALGHFVKREVESLFVHRFSHATMPVIRIPLNCFHYWLLFGVFVGYYIFHPHYVAPFESFPLIRPLCVTMMIGAEICNLMTHITLRNLRARGSRDRGIPYGWGFDFVTCANYFWETVIWVSFSLYIGTLSAWFFTLVAFVQMTDWAFKKHRSYKKEFKSYPPQRKAIIPFLL